MIEQIPEITTLELRAKVPADYVYIVAGSYEQARDLAKYLVLSPIRWSYVSVSDELRGQSGTVLFWGTWYYRADREQVEAEIRANSGLHGVKIHA